MSALQAVVIGAACGLGAYWSYSCLLLLKAIHKQNEGIFAALQRIEYATRDDKLPELD
jgi:hypothetical protein